ncbi:MAG: peptidase S9 [Verrucomicrobiales bacterium]|nr:peptidase S9 [Verrucomicrobiales bacterium]
MDPSRMFPFAADFAKRFGMVAVCPQYRLYKPDKSVTVFDCVKDARSSVRYTRAHAAELGIDPDKIVVSGASAGGHLAVSTALFDDVYEETDDMAVPCLPNALILYFPVIDTSPEGYGQKKIGEEWKELSPAHNVRKGVPPTLTFHGTGDNTCPFEGAKLFHEEMLKAGNTSQLEVTEGGGHGYLIFDKDIYLDSLDKAENFLKANGILEK